jgi:phosphatidate cytidylyltransferase
LPRRARHLGLLQKASPPRAGRNLPAAIGVAVVLLTIIGVSLAFWKPAFVVLVTVIAVIGARELGTAIRQGRVHPPLPPLLVAAALVPLAYWGGPDALTAGFAAAVALVLLWRAAGPPEGAVRDIAGGVFIVAYVPLLAAITSLMLAEPDGVGRIVTFILVTVASDTGGYAVGVLRGRTPMAPQLSPKKSWEGFAGSVATSALVGVLCVTLLLDGPWWAGAVVGGVAAAFGTVGDLTESAIKRDLGIKDMGALLPGHGGLMDRLDSLLVTAPVCWALLHVLL